MTTFGKFIPPYLKRPLLRLYFQYKRGFDLVERSSNPFATHMPILVGLSTLVPIRNILELGCGNYSTRLFLDKIIFPHVQQVRSIENDENWVNEIKSNLGTDSRLDLVSTTGAISDVITNEVLDDYDLIFIDDSWTVPERTVTISTVCKQKPQTSLVVIHDFEQPAYRNASADFRNRYHFKVFNPTVGILWNEHNLLNYEMLGKLQKHVKRHAQEILLDDTAKWFRILNTR